MADVAAEDNAVPPNPDFPMAGDPEPFFPDPGVGDDAALGGYDPGGFGGDFPPDPDFGGDLYGDPAALPPPGGLDAGSGAPAQENMDEEPPSPTSPKVRRVRPSQTYKDKPVITRLHMLDYVSTKEWWYEGQNQLMFTTLLWFVFIYIMYTRAGITQSFNLHLSVMQHMENIVAHPHLSGIRVREVVDNPVPCTCACQSSTAGMPKGPCDPYASERLDFLGHLNASSPRLSQYLPSWATGLGDKLDTGHDDILPMTWNTIAHPEDVWFWVEHGFIPDLWRKRSQSGASATCGAWPTKPNWGCTETGEAWKKLSDSSTPQWCKSLCAAASAETSACCLYAGDACWVKVGAVASNTTGGSGLAMMCHPKANAELQGLVAQKNLIIGGVRARQKRAEWSPDCQDKTTAGMVTFFGSQCRSSVDATSYGLRASLNNSAFKPSTTADGYFDGLFDVEFNITDALATATMCRKNNWIDGATRSLNLQTVTLNAEIGMFAIVDIEFKFPAGGGVEKKVGVHTIHAVGSKIEFIDIVPELIWAGLILVLIRQEVVQMAYSGWERKCLDYWLDLWCVVDWVSIFCALLITIFWMLQMGSIGTISEEVGLLPRSPFASGPPADVNAYHTTWQKILDDSIVVYERKAYYQLALFWYTLILTSRFLKGFLSQSKLAMLQMTVGTTFWDLCHLLVFFAMIFLNFQLGGHILFGAQLEEWSDMIKSGATSVRMLLGTYLFDPMYEINPVAATCWFWGFLLTMSFILMNLIFAMIADYFHGIRESVGDTDSVYVDAKNAMKDLWWRLGWRKINIEDGEYKIAFCDNPYNEVVEGLMEACEVPVQLERDAHHTCLGVRMGRQHIEASSIEGLTAEENKGYVEATSKGIQEYGADIMAADHLLELAEPHVIQETKRRNESQLSMIRHFVQLLRNHSAEIEEHCAGLETEVTVDHSSICKSVDYLEIKVRNCLEEFAALKDTGVHSLAPPLPPIPRPGTLAAHEAQQQSFVAPGALMRAIEIHNKPPKVNGITAPKVEEVPMGMLGTESRGPSKAVQLALHDDTPGNMPLRALTNQPAAQAIGNAQGAGEMFELRDAGLPDNQAIPPSPPALAN
jgi:hypothetical protein